MRDGDAPLPRPRRVGLAVSLAASMGAPPLLVHGMSALGPLLMADLEISRSQFGSVATVFFLTAAVVAARLGGLVDRRGERYGVLLLYLCTLVALVTTAAAGSFLGVLLSVMLAGIGLAVSSPLTNTMVAARLPRGQRGLLMGIKQSGVQVAQTVAGLTFPVIAVAASWRGSILVGALLVLAGLLWGLVVTAGASAEPRGDARVTSRGALPRSLWWLVAYAFLSGAGTQATNFYLPLFGHEALGLSVPVAALTVALAGAMGIGARVLWGRATDRVRDPYTPLSLLGAVPALAAVLLVVAARAGSPVALWLGVALFGATALAANVVVMAAVIDLVDLRVAGNATGVITAGLFAGFAVGPFCFGALVDASGSYTAGWVLVGTTFALVTGLALVRRGRSRQ